MSQGHLCQMLLLNRNPGRKKKSPVGVGSKIHLRDGEVLRLRQQMLKQRQDRIERELNFRKE